MLELELRIYSYKVRRIAELLEVCHISDESSSTTTPEPVASTSTDPHTTPTVTEEIETSAGVSTVTVPPTEEPKPSTDAAPQRETTAASPAASTDMSAGLIAGISIAAIIITVYTVLGIGALIGYVLVLQMILQRKRNLRTFL